MKIGDRVEWMSQSGGFRKFKRGEIVAVVPAGKTPGALDNWFTLAEGRTTKPIDPRSFSRKHESYIVLVGRVLYWPVVSVLRREQQEMPVDSRTNTAHVSPALYATIDQLRGELAAMTADRNSLRFALEAWQSTFGTSQLSHAQARLERAERDRDEARRLLSLAVCPECDGSGIRVTTIAHYETGEPSEMQVQCQWCDERKAAITAAGMEG